MQSINSVGQLSRPSMTLARCLPHASDWHLSAKIELSPRRDDNNAHRQLLAQPHQAIHSAVSLLSISMLCIQAEVIILQLLR